MIQFAKPCIKLSKFEMKEISKICYSGQLCEGKYVEEVEDYFRSTYSVKHAITCSSATQGLIIALKAAKIKDMRIALPAFTWPSTLYAIQCNECDHEFIDIDLDTWDISEVPEFTIQNGVWKNYIDVIIPVDIFGNESYYSKYLDTRPIIYDAAHGFGLKDLGHRGLAEVVSFSFTKPVTGMQGGIILTDSENLAEEACELRRLSAKMCEINALILLNEIKRSEEKLYDRKRLINLYRNYIEMPYTEQKVKYDSNYSTYSLLFNPKKRDKIAKAFKENNIEVKIYYKPLITGLPNTDYIYSCIISLPVYPEIEKEIPRICKIINEA